ncbi:cytochrome P450 4B1-like [Eublepharis macularius]|uniref:Cytochrome P450 4B1-like n=1 Tax=Eublepharis macularius TaxID=481883 RepID=A0AA97JDL0_EUBMA|nr:cytochrome P450 4B1-like [Eublepharis macularius]
MFLHGFFSAAESVTPGNLNNRNLMEEESEPNADMGGSAKSLLGALTSSFWFWLPQDFCQICQLIIILIFTYVVLKAIMMYRQKQYLIQVLRCFPGPPTHWLYGHFKMMKPEEEFLTVESWTKIYPHCYPIWYGGFLPFLNINHPEYVKAIFSRGDPKSLVVYNFLVPWIGKGLLILNGPKWQRHRKLLTPGFHYDVLKPYVPLMADSVKVMLDKWEKLVPKDRTTPVELFEHVSLMTLDSIMKCAFSYESNCQMNRDNSYIKTVFDLCFMFYQRMKTPLHHNDLIYWFTSEGRQFRKGCKIAHHHTDKVIRERKESLKDVRELEKILKKRHLDFLDILLCAKDENGNPLSVEDLRAEVDTFMFEGHDTTASGISWLLYCMALNPEHQQRCREEIQELLGEQETIQWNDLGKMTYTTMCIKESLRLYPPVPMIARELEAPVTFADGRTLPKGFLAMLHFYALHRNPEVWDNPEVFNPLRFSLENAATRHPYAFLPFAAGPRNCIGQQFAMNEMKVALALTLLRFELSPNPSHAPIPIPQVITRSKNGIVVNLKILH